ncbi:MAG: hypothetical protein AAF698_01125 [Pseudomonadota bacterium]
MPTTISKAVIALTLGAALSGCTGTGLSKNAVGDLFGSAFGSGEGYPRIVARGVDLDPAARPGPAVFGDRWVRDLANGGEERLGLSASRRRIHLSDADGCEATRLMDWFSPSVAWSGCGNSDNWHTASAKVGVRGSLYPLRVGGRGRYERWATAHTGKTSFRTTDCVVSDAVTLDLGRRRADAFEVRCDDGRIERITWFAPNEGPIAYREAHHSRGLRQAWVVAD